MILKNRFFLLIAVSAVILHLMASAHLPQKKRTCPRAMALNEGRSALPYGYNELFAGSGECLMCHNSMTNANGDSIGILSDWRSTMMAHSAKDPFWRAKVSHETLVNPSHTEALEDVCTRCHSPAGHFNAHFLGLSYYGIDDMVADPLALDGGNCTVCHQVTEETLGNHSGNLVIGTEKLIWGRYPGPFAFPMFNNTGYTPVYSEHIKDSRLCGACHTLLTNSVDLEGNLTGEQFVEQAIYHEWLNSGYPESNRTCQACHIPEINEPVKISLMPPWLEGRSPFGLHHIAGGNVFMQRILRENLELLGITANTKHIDSTISRTLVMLQDSSLELTLAETARTADTLFLRTELKNLAGHKLPTGFPSRRIYVEVTAESASGDTIFHSGKTDTNYEILHEDTPYELHHKVLRSEDQVQIYEMVMGDVNGNLTTVLERGYSHLKDNRLPPSGFLTSHPVYDTVEIAGLAEDDEDFNKSLGNEGAGKDDLLIHIPLEGYTGLVETSVKVRYQTVNQKWLEDMFNYSSGEIDLWRSLFEASDREPVLLAEARLSSSAIFIKEPDNNNFTVFPNPSRDIIYIGGPQRNISACTVFDLNGKMLTSVNLSNENRHVDLSLLKSGIYLLKLHSPGNKNLVQKVILR